MSKKKDEKKDEDISENQSNKDTNQEYIQTLKDGGIIHFDNETFCTLEIELSKLSIKYEARSIEENMELMRNILKILINDSNEISSMTELNFANWLEKKLIKIKGDKKLFKCYEITNNTTNETTKEDD